MLARSKASGETRDYGRGVLRRLKRAIRELLGKPSRLATRNGAARRVDDWCGDAYRVGTRRSACPQCAHRQKRPEPLGRFRPINIGRDGGIRTHDPLTPSQVRYQAALHPDAESFLFYKRFSVSCAPWLARGRAPWVSPPSSRARRRRGCAARTIPPFPRSSARPSARTPAPRSCCSRGQAAP